MATEKLALGLVTGDFSQGWVGAYTIGADNTVMARNTVATRGTSTDPRVFPIRTTGDAPLMMVNSYRFDGVGDLGKPGVGTYGIYDPRDWQTEVANAQSNTNPVGNPYPPIPDVQQWSTTNPYGLVVVGNYMYLLANDAHPVDRTCSIYKYDMTNNTFTQVGSVYTFNPDIPGDPTQWKGAGYGLDLYVDSARQTYLVAVFARFTNEGWSYTFGDSAIVKIKLSDGSATMANANANVNGVVVNEKYAYVTSYGGPQLATGNPASELEIFDISGATITSVQEIRMTAFNAVKYKEGTEEFAVAIKGDAVDIVFVVIGYDSEGKPIYRVYILFAHYNADYTKYEYTIINILKSELDAGNLANARAIKKQIVDPASPCFALLPGEGTNLYFVDGVHVNKIDTGVAIADFSPAAITEQISAGDFTNGALVGGLINTAAVVMERTVPAPAMRMAAGAVKASVTKIAKRLARPDELERKE